MVDKQIGRQRGSFSVEYTDLLCVTDTFLASWNALISQVEIQIFCWDVGYDYGLLFEIEKNGLLSC